MDPCSILFINLFLASKPGIITIILKRDLDHWKDKKNGTGGHNLEYDRFKKTDVRGTRRNGTHPKNNRNDGAWKDCRRKSNTKGRVKNERPLGLSRAPHASSRPLRYGQHAAADWSSA